MTVILVTGMVFQTIHGYHHYELTLYIRYLFGYAAVRYLFYCLIAVGLQCISNNRFQGYAMFALLYLFERIFRL